MKQSIRNEKISELYTNEKKSKYSSKPNDILKPAKSFYKKLYTKEGMSKTAIAEPFSKNSNRKKISNEQFHHCEANNFLEKVTKSINSQTNIKSSSNDKLIAKFYEHLSKELSCIL